MTLVSAVSLRPPGSVTRSWNCNVVLDDTPGALNDVTAAPGADSWTAGPLS
ncbi:MAG: hypothetical protein U5K38_17995 [Woeseiaceae bacterium]|nr:hypothetical protein [Woeseiaceae bacterium]